MHTQMDLARDSALSLKTISEIEAKGDLATRERGTLRLLALSLKVREEDLARMARGEIEDAPLPQASGEFEAELARLTEAGATELGYRLTVILDSSRLLTL